MDTPGGGKDRGTSWYQGYQGIIITTFILIIIIIKDGWDFDGYSWRREGWLGTGWYQRVSSLETCQSGSVGGEH